MPEIPTEVPGQLVTDLCEKLGLDPKEVFKIEIEPRGLIVTHTYRRTSKGKMLLVGIDDILRQHTDIKIRW